MFPAALKGNYNINSHKDLIGKFNKIETVGNRRRRHMGKSVTIILYHYHY